MKDSPQDTTHQQDTNEHTCDETNPGKHAHTASIFTKVFLTTAVLIMGTAMFGMISSGKFKNYLQPFFAPILLATVIVLVLLAVWKIYALSDEIIKPVHAHPLPRIGALLLIPAFIFLLSTPNSLGEDAAGASSYKRVANMHMDFAPLPMDRVIDTSVLDISDRFTLGKSQDLAGRKVKMIGFVAHPADMPEDMWSLNRFRIFCCAADATLFNVAIKKWPKPEGKGWVEVEGEIKPDEDPDIAVIIPTKVTPIPEPENPYL